MVSVDERSVKKRTMKPAWLDQYPASVPPNLDYPDKLLPALLSDAARQWPRRAAIRFYGKTIRYQVLDQLASRFASGLSALGVQKGAVLAIMLPNLPQTVIAYYGALRAGAVVTPINPLYVENEILRQVEDSGCEVMLALNKFHSRVRPLLGRTSLRYLILTSVHEYLPWLKRVLYPLKHGREATGIAENGDSAIRLFNSLLRRNVEGPGISGSPNDLALLQYSGGTTGVPKGVMLTHRNLVCNTWQCRSWIPELVKAHQIFLGVLPFFHVYGMTTCQNLCFSVGGTLVLLPRFHAPEVLKTIAQERITVFPGIPSMYSAINNCQHLDRCDLGSVRLCISGAGPLPLTVQERFEALTGARLMEGYGLTEASPVTHINPVTSTGARRTRSIGLPLPDTEAKVVDMESGEQEMPDGDIGELVIKGPQVMAGYCKREEETRQVLRKGWLYTGDLARRDADGFFYIQDRKKDMIKSGGENVFPREVEEVLLRHPKVKDACVVGLPLGLRGEIIKAYVVLKDNQSSTPAEILGHCRKELARFKIPKRVEFRPELPKTLVGKVLRRVLIEEELKKHAGRPLPETEADEATEK
jgi:long-chain acyl-CoA synthetase